MLNIFSPKIKISSESKNEMKISSFSSKECPITIGRAKCKLNFYSDLLSKRHCRIDYVENEFFFMDGYNNKRSTNGSWYAYF